MPFGNQLIALPAAMKRMIMSLSILDSQVSICEQLRKCCLIIYSRTVGRIRHCTVVEATKTKSRNPQGTTDVASFSKGGRRAAAVAEELQRMASIERAVVLKAEQIVLLLKWI